MTPTPKELPALPDERKAFEAWRRSTSKTAPDDAVALHGMADDAIYVSAYTRAAWAAWQARAASLQGIERDAARFDWLERFGTDRFSKNATTRKPECLWFDCSTDGSDYSPDLRTAIDRAIAAMKDAP